MGIYSHSTSQFEDSKKFISPLAMTDKDGNLNKFGFPGAERQVCQQSLKSIYHWNLLKITYIFCLLMAYNSVKHSYFNTGTDYNGG